MVGRDAGLIKDSAGADPAANLYFLYTGMKVNTWALTISPTEITTSTFGLLGRQEDIVDRETPTTIKGGNDPFSGFSGSGQIDGSEICILSFDMTLNNNLGTEQFCLGEKFRNSLPEGQRQIEGTFTTEFQDLVLYTKFLQGTPVKIEIILDLLENILLSHL